MSNYSQTPHPFLSGSGSCQSERYPALLNPDSVKIDDLELDDILQFINKYSRFINFYDENYNITNWQALFDKSIPFQIAALGNLDVNELEENFARILQLMDAFPTEENFQLFIDFIFTELVLIFENSLRNTGGIDAPFSVALQRIMSANLRMPLLAFIEHTKELGALTSIEGIAFNDVLTTAYWDIPPINDIAPSSIGDTAILLTALENNANVFINELRSLASQTAQFLPASLYPNEESRKGKISPHIGLLIAFLALQDKFKADLNDITRRHLLYFYEDILQVKGKPARPDETFLYFELQKQIKTSYLVPKGTKVKDGKDDNKADIIFALEKDVVLDKATIKELRTLYLNPVQGYLPAEGQGGKCTEDDLETFIEGLYIAPKANSADGVEEDFKEDPKNWATLGAKASKLLQRDETYKEHPEARVGFVLASPVLYLNEGKRTIDVTLYCKDISEESEADKAIATLFGTKESSPVELLDRLISDKATGELTELDFDQILPTLWSGDPFVNFEESIGTELNEQGEQISIPLFIEDQRLEIIDLFELIPEDNDDDEDNGEEEEIIGFSYNIQKLILLIETPSIGLQENQGVFLLNKLAFNNQISAAAFANLNDDFGKLLSRYLYVKPFQVYLSGEEEWLEVASKDVTMELVEATGDSPTFDLLLTFKIELQDDFPAVTFSNSEILGLEVGTDQPSIKIEIDPNYKVICPSELYQPCCTLSHCKAADDIEISPYHFLKDLTVVDSCIEVEVCGVKNLIVQNEESVQDVNGLVYPFGARPEVADFDKDFFFDPLEAPKNLIGPNFYIGSKEVFLKNWEQVNVNISWKDKPTDFNEHYLAYRFADLNNNGTISLNSQEYGLIEEEFQINLSILDEGVWLREKNNTQTTQNSFTNHHNRQLFARKWDSINIFEICENLYNQVNENPFDQVIKIKNDQFLDGNSKFSFKEVDFSQFPYRINTRNGFLRIGLENQDFMHKEYAFILARQMMALGRFPDSLLEEAVYIDRGRNVIISYVSLGNLISDVRTNLALSITAVNASDADAVTLQSNVLTTKNDTQATVDEINNNGLTNAVAPLASTANNSAQAALTAANSHLVQTTDSVAKVQDVNSKLSDLENGLSTFGVFGQTVTPLEIPIPNEPWTPIIKEISIDYTAKAEATDIELVHLYPFEGTYKTEEITATPSLLPVLADEGTLFLALENVTKGNTLNLLFHFAEATANTEMDKPDISWAYLKNNNWEALRPGFDVLHDGTDGFTKTGIVEIAVPLDISNQGHTIMPTDAYWIKAAAKQNSKAVCETISIHTQAVKVIAELSPNNDRQRLRQPLEVDKISKLNKADTSIKKIAQPVPSFNGRPPESDAPELLYRRISERLRHKGRAITGFDYERIVLEHFSQVFKAKTVSHTLGLPGSKYVHDMEMAAPGHVLLAVIPDIKKLNGGNALEPRVPLSQLTDIKKLLQQKNSPFVRLKVLNPRYEKVNVAIKVKFKTGNTGPFYKDLLAKDIEYFLAPWTKGNTDRLQFGGVLSRSKLIAFVERLSYVDYLCQIDWIHEFDLDNKCEQEPLDCDNKLSEIRPFIAPLTARSILTAGTISVCELDRPCTSYDKA